VCSAAVMTLDCGALATTIPRLVAAATSTLSTPTPARPTARSLVARASRAASSVVAERIGDYADPLAELLGAPAGAEVDVEVVAQQRDAGVSDLLGDEHAGLFIGAHDRSRTQSTQAVSASTSDGSVAGNIATRS
jgi:hypothetical protein